MSNSNSILLNRFFTRNTFKQVINDETSSAFESAVRQYITDYLDKTNKECISEIYQYLREGYQNEYFYKNTLLNKLLLGIHSPRTTTALTEVPIGDSKADFILINGEAIVYEIKTPLDNLDRLDGQIKDYFKAFSKVIVFTSEENCDNVLKKLHGSPAGIKLLSKNGRLKSVKKPIEYSEDLSKSVMFKILRKSEYEDILLKQFGYLPEVSQFEYYRACQALFESLPTDVAHKLFITSLKGRMKIDIMEYSKIPYELKFLVYFSNYKKSDYTKLCHFLSKFSSK